MEHTANHSGQTFPRRCDLHTHSVFSDGTYTPEELIDHAKQQNLIIALTDHNTAAGLPDFMAAAQKAGVTAVPGVEFSTEHDGTELHLLALFVMPEHYAAMEAIVSGQHALKERTNRNLVDRLDQAGYHIRYEDVQRRNPAGNPNRAHVAAELLERGYVTSIQEAFDTLLDEKCGFYEPPHQLPLMDVIRQLRQLGILPVLAHPLEDLTAQALRQLLPTAKEAGLLGMETRHGDYTPDTIRIAEEIAAEFHLLPSGGSDFHGSVKPEIALGTGKGQLAIPPEVYSHLLDAWKALQI